MKSWCEWSLHHFDSHPLIFHVDGFLHILDEPLLSVVSGLFPYCFCEFIRELVVATGDRVSSVLNCVPCVLGDIVFRESVLLDSDALFLDFSKELHDFWVLQISSQRACFAGVFF